MRYYFTTWCEQKGKKQELADELSESLEWHTGTMKVPSKGAWAMAHDKYRLLAENDFGKLLNIVVADGQHCTSCFCSHTELTLVECL